MAIQTQPLVSVIVPTRNRPRLLQDALASIAAQTYPHLEMVVVNDGGENVGNEVAAAARERPHVYLEFPRRLGPGAARNKGLSHARGDLIAYLDDDDLFLPDHVATLAAALVRNPTAVAAYSQIYERIRRQAGNQWETVSRTVKPLTPFSRARLLVHNYIAPLSLMHRKAVLARSGGFDESLEALEDWDFFIRLALAGEFVAVPAVTAEYTVSHDASHRGHWDANRLNIIWTILARYDKLATPQIREEQRKAWPPIRRPPPPKDRRDSHS